MAFSMQILKSSFGVGVDKFKNDMGSRNYGIYGKWIGILTSFLCLALGIANIFHFSLVIIFSIIAIVQGFLILFVELPFLLKICPFNQNKRIGKIVIILQMLGKVVILPYELHDFSVPYLDIIDPVYW